MKSNLRTLGPREASVMLTVEAEKDDVVTIKRIRDITGLAADAAMNIASRLAKKGWLERVSSGRYMVVPARYGPERTGENNVLALASEVVQPSYIGWWAAASLHGFTTQKPFGLNVATTRRAASREILGIDVHFVMLTSRKFFGWEEREVYGRRVMVSDGAKTALDCVDRPALCGGVSEAARIVWGAASIDASLLVDYALRMGSVSTAQRLGFLRDIVDKPIEGEARERLRSMIPRSARTTIGHRERRDGDIGYVAEWGVVARISKDAILSDIPKVRPLQLKSRSEA